MGTTRFIVSRLSDGCFTMFIVLHLRKTWLRSEIKVESLFQRVGVHQVGKSTRKSVIIVYF